MTKTYDQHHAAFRDVSAFVIMKGRNHVARVAFKFARSGLQTKCYAHWFGTEMVSGSAGGGGYDKSSASAGRAARKMPVEIDPDEGWGQSRHRHYTAFRKALIQDSGPTWETQLQNAGFVVLQAV